MEKNWLLPFTYIALLLINLLYYLTKFLPIVPRFLDYSYRFVSENYFFFSMLEFMGVIAIFVDIVVNYDRYPGHWRKWRMLVTGLFIISMLFKFLLTYIDHSLLNNQSL